CLARPGWSSHEHDAVRQSYQPAENVVDLLVHPEFLQRELHVPLVEQTHDDALAMDHGDNRNADVDLSAVHADLDSPILRQPLLRNIEPRHDFQAANNGGAEVIDFRWHRLRLQDAVDAVANLDAGVLRLDVHVAGAHVDCFEQNLIDQPNDRSL